MRATTDELRVHAHISKCYGLENIGFGQIGILFTFPGGGEFSRSTERITRDIRHSHMTDDK